MLLVSLSHLAIVRAMTQLTHLAGITALSFFVFDYCMPLLDAI
jgi:hypothetical protein